MKAIDKLADDEGHDKQDLPKEEKKVFGNSPGGKEVTKPVRKKAKNASEDARDVAEPVKKGEKASQDAGAKRKREHVKSD